MKLFLTSAGIVPEITDEFLKLLGKNPKNAKLTYIPTASDPEPDKTYCQDTARQLSEMGFSVFVVDLKNQSKKSLGKILKDADVVFVEGGNTFYLLDWVCKSGFDRVLKQFLERGGVYVGVSAGSVIAGLNIEPASWKHADKNIVDLKDLTGLGLVQFLITPHYSDEVSGVVREAASKVDYPIVALTDLQAILVDSDKAKIVGPGDKITFNKPRIF